MGVMHWKYRNQFNMVLNHYMRYLILTYLILTTTWPQPVDSSDQSEIGTDLQEFNRSDDIEFQQIEAESVKINFRKFWNLHDQLPKFARLSVRYSLVLEDILRSPASGLMPCNRTLDHVRVIQVYENVTAECEESLEGYDLGDDRAKRIRTICGSQTVLYKRDLTSMSENSLDIKFLLPNQLYKFEFQVEYNMSNTKWVTAQLNRSTEYLCTGKTETRPKFAPETDLGAFVIHQSGPQDKTTRAHNSADQMVDLYWRPLSPILTDSNDLTYKISCLNQRREMVFQDECRYRIGHTSFLKPANLTFFCTLRAANSNGVSKRSTNILIPPQHHFIHLGVDFKFYVILIGEGEFLIKWIPVEDHLISRNMTEQSVELSTRGGSYTVYWCGVQDLYSCSELSKFVVTNDSSLRIKTTLSKFPQRLGLSYRSHDHLRFSGIIWSKCITNLKTDPYLHDPLKAKLHGAINHNSLHIYWDFEGCDSIRAMIDHFEVSYLPIKKYDDCSDEASSLDSPYVIEDIDCDRQECRSIQLADQFASETTLHGLDSATLYMIKMRCIYTDGLSNRWSRPLFGTTTEDPKQQERCRRNVLYLGVFIIVMLLVTTAHISYRSRTWWRHYYGVLFKYRNIKSDLSQQFVDCAPTTCDSMNRLNTEHWFSPNIDNQTSSSTNGALPFEPTGNHALNNNQNNNLGDELDFQQIPFEDRLRKEQVITAYIPKALLETRIDQTTPECSTEDELKYRESTELDDISITSHTSFLQTIFDNQGSSTDVNNNLGRSLLDLGTLTTARYNE